MLEEVPKIKPKSQNIFHTLQQRKHDFSDSLCTCLIKDWLHHEGLVNMGHVEYPDYVLYSYQRNHITVVVNYPISTDDFSFMCVKDNS